MRNLFRKRKKAGKQLVCASMILAMVVTVPAYDGAMPKDSLYQKTNVFATSAKEKKKKAEEDLNKVNQDIDKLEDKKDKVQSSLNEREKKLKKLLEKQEILQGQIIDKQSEINQCSLDLEQAQADELKQYEAMKLRIRFMYENSTEDSLWTAIVEAEGIADMLNRIEYITSVYQSDRKLMKKYQKAVASVQKLSEKLGTDMDDLMALQETYEGQQCELEETIVALQSERSQYATQIAEAERQAENFQKIIKEQGEIIRAQEAAAAAEAARREAERQQRLAAAAAAAQAAQQAAEYEGGGAGNEGINNGDKYLNDPSCNPANTTNVSGGAVVNYALQFVGNRYVWGGNSLTNGVDCSGFVHQVYAHFGIKTPRYSQSFLDEGKPVSFSNIQAGDVVVYPGHVAIYIGNGKIVEAQSTRAGITSYRSVTCHTINGIRRYV